MVKTYAYGFPRIGKNREYKKYIENFWKRKNSEVTLNTELISIENEKFKEIELLAKEGASLLPVWIEKPIAWIQTNLTKPEFDGSGRLLLKEMIKDNE